MADLSGKRLLFLITKSNWGGAQSYVHTLATRFQERGVKVAVALGGMGRPGTETGQLALRLAQGNVRTIVVPSLARDISPVHELHALRELVTLLKRERPDILHLNSSKAGVLGAFAGRIARVPRIVFTVHGWPHREPVTPLSRFVRRAGSWLTILLSHAVIAVSECDYKTAPVFFSRRKIQVVHNGVEASTLLSREEARAFLAPSIPELRKLRTWILVPAELTRNKGIDFAIKAFAGVSTNIDDSALVIAGEGEDHAELLELIRAYRLTKRAFLLGFVPNVRQYFKAADIFLMPSRKEGYPLALLEAGHASLPVIASDTGGIPEIIENKKTGLLIRPGDIDGLADSLTRLLLNPDEAARLGNALHEKVGAFTEADMLSETSDIYIKR